MPSTNCSAVGVCGSKHRGFLQGGTASIPARGLPSLSMSANHMRYICHSTVLPRLHRKLDLSMHKYAHGMRILRRRALQFLSQLCLLLRSCFRKPLCFLQLCHLLLCTLPGLLSFRQLLSRAGGIFCRLGKIAKLICRT